jgi:hypothetical protein
MEASLDPQLTVTTFDALEENAIPLTMYRKQMQALHATSKTLHPFTATQRIQNLTYETLNPSAKQTSQLY